MDINQEKYHKQISAYLRDELSPEEKKLFEKSLTQNPELLQEFKIHQELFAQVEGSEDIVVSWDYDKEDVRALTTYFRSEEAEKLKKTIQKAKNNYQGYKKQRVWRKNIILPLLVAASIAVFVLVYTFNSKSSTTEMYVKHSEWEDLPSLTSRGGDNKLAEGERLFVDKKYKESYAIFTALSQKEQQPSVLIYLGLCALELDQLDKALHYFELLKNTEAIDSSKAYWYLALTYLKQNEKEKATNILQELVSGNHYKNTEARELLDQLQ
ncbi:hypothetical protein [Aquimarina muelleri]|uniref:Tetratricopeptide repeat protein 21A/21B second ARM domain-containing protein n=1 Tax=Aquimarina muelleri TaxID=279356 RepID=A0A918JT63_9FLAO|nr:hypothetical protein [Aquimarina muelleri]MCX2764030.1 hypothetical protein [Aquimarina muelleri]GGX12056.1 hypothetical protein GCM10007384_12240 [Aquimarina muelleri]